MSERSIPGQRAAPTLRAAGALALVCALLAALELVPDVQRVFDPLNVALARLTELGLGYLEIPVSRNGAVLAHADGFSYRISYVCSGVRPAVLIVVAMLAVPATWRWRLAGFAAAFVALEALNLCRLLHLYWTGVAHPETFFFFHRVAWNLAFVAAVTALLALWLALAARTPPGRRTSEHRRTPPARRCLHIHV